MIIHESKHQMITAELVLALYAQTWAPAIAYVIHLIIHGIR